MYFPRTLPARGSSVTLGILLGDLKVLPLWHESSCHKTSSGDMRWKVWLSCWASRGSHYSLCEGDGVPKRAASCIASHLMVLSVMHLKEDLGRRELDKGQVSLVLGFYRREREKLR